MGELVLLRHGVGTSAAEVLGIEPTGAVVFRKWELAGTKHARWRKPQRDTAKEWRARYLGLLPRDDKRRFAILLNEDREAAARVRP